MPVSIPLFQQKRKKRLIHVVVNLRPRTKRSEGFVIVEMLTRWLVKFSRSVKSLTALERRLNVLVEIEYKSYTRLPNWPCHAEMVEEEKFCQEWENGLLLYPWQRQTISRRSLPGNGLRSRHTKKWVQWGILSPLFISFQEFPFAFALKESFDINLLHWLT